jgi:ferritin-like metal-binding protein YciE
MASRKTTSPTKTKSRATEVPFKKDFLYQALETELGGVKVYQTALRCVQNDDLREEWEKYLEQTEKHVQILEDVCRKMGLDPKAASPGRKVVDTIGKALVKAMEMALESGDESAAEIVAAECVTLAETKDHANWQLIGKLAESLDGPEADALQEAHDEVEEEEDEHLYHTAGWARELSLQALGLPCELPPAEEEEDVHSAEEAAEAQKHAGEHAQMAGRSRSAHE